MISKHRIAYRLPNIVHIAKTATTRTRPIATLCLATWRSMYWTVIPKIVIGLMVIEALETFTWKLMWTLAQRLVRETAVTT